MNKTIPDKINNLVNLRTISFRNCNHKYTFPNIGNLMNLRHAFCGVNCQHDDYYVFGDSMVIIYFSQRKHIIVGENITRLNILKEINEQIYLPNSLEYLRINKISTEIINLPISLTTFKMDVN